MTLDLEAIKARHARWLLGRRMSRHGDKLQRDTNAGQAARDRAALLAEAARLQAENVDLRMQVANLDRYERDRLRREDAAAQAEADAQTLGAGDER